MQEERDSIDKAIFEAFKEVDPSIDYNRRLFEKLQSQSINRKNNLKPMAVSLILSGIIAMMLYTSNIQFQIMDFKYKVISQIFAVQYNYKYDIQKIIIGE